MISQNLSRRLERLEEHMSPNAEPIIIDVVFVNAAKEPTRGFQIKVPMTGMRARAERGVSATEGEDRGALWSPGVYLAGSNDSNNV